MSHSDQFYKLWFTPNTPRVRRDEIIHRVHVGCKHDRSTTYRTLGPRFCIISIVNVNFDIMPQSSCKGLAMIELTVA